MFYCSSQPFFHFGQFRVHTWLRAWSNSFTGIYVIFYFSISFFFFDLQCYFLLLVFQQGTSMLYHFCFESVKSITSLILYLYDRNLNCPMSHKLVLECSISYNLVCLLANFVLTILLELITFRF